MQDVFDPFENPGKAVEVSPSPDLSVVRLAGSEPESVYEPTLGRFTLDEREIRSLSEHRAWVGVGARLSALARVLGGTTVMESFRSGSGEERHQIRYLGPGLEV